MLNQAVRRNLDRFPPDFIFSLTREEIFGISQNVTSSKIKFSKHVYAFTEQGVAMLSSVLRSKRAVEVKYRSHAGFVRLRKFVSTHSELAAQLAKLENHLTKHDDQIQAIFEAIRQLMASPAPKEKQIGFRSKSLKK